jgi:hypothetical protein
VEEVQVLDISPQDFGEVGISWCVRGQLPFLNRSHDWSHRAFMGEQEGKPILVHRMHSTNTHMSQVGERRVSFIYSILAIGLELIVWLVPSLISGGVAVSIIGVILGPLYPIAMNHAVRILPGWLLTGNLVFVSMRW